MKRIRGVRRAVPPHLTASSGDADIDAELAGHLERLEAELREGGMDPEDARREAVRRFGSLKRVRARVRAVDRPWEERMMGGELLGTFGQDLRYAWRQLRKNRGFASVAILTLALGVGLTTAMFTVVNGVLLRPLPFAHPDELVAVGVQSSQEATGGPYVRDEHYAEMEGRLSSFAGTSGYMVYPPTTLSGAGDAVALTAAWATPGFFDVLGVPPEVGGPLPAENGQSASPSVVVLGDELWRSRFGADPAVVGKTATLDAVPRTILGVMPPGFTFPGHTELWLPMESHPMREEGLSFGYEIVGRLREGVSSEQARAELSALAASSGWRIGRGDEPLTIRVMPLKDIIIGDGRYPLMIFAGAVVLVLLIACTNVANLLLMRAGARETEVGLRGVLGAGRLRIMRQLLTESVMLAFLGGALGIVVADLALRTLLALAPPGTIPRGQELSVDPTVLGFTLAVSLVTGVVFGLVPALKASRRDLRVVIGGAVRTHTRRRSLGRCALVVSELGLSLVLLTGAGLLLRSFHEVRSVDLGFEPAHTLTFYVDLPQEDYPTTESILDLHRRVVSGLSRIPAVEEVGAANFEPFGPLNMTARVRTEEESDRRTPVGWMTSSPGYFAAMGIPLLSGRDFTAGDDASGPEVVVVSRSLAELLWPGRDPLGRRLWSGQREWVTVVGVVEDVVQRDPTADQMPLMYVPLGQMTQAQQLRHLNYVARVAPGAGSVAATMRDVVRESDASLPIERFLSLDQIVLESLGDRRFEMRVLAAFAVLALLLAAVGVYGVMSYSVNERTREMGIRIALGARKAQLARSTLAGVFALVIGGLVLGALGARATSRLLESSLYEVSPVDPLTYAVVAMLLAVVTLCAAAVPIRRATRVSPLEVLVE